MATAAVAAAAFEAAAQRWRCGRPGAAQEPEAEGDGRRAAANGGVRARGGASGRRGDRGRPLPRRRGPGVAVEEAEARRGVGAETEARRGDGGAARRRGGGGVATGGGSGGEIDLGGGES